MLFGYIHGSPPGHLNETIYKNIYFIVRTTSHKFLDLLPSIDGHDSDIGLWGHRRLTSRPISHGSVLLKGNFTRRSPSVSRGGGLRPVSIYRAITARIYCALQALLPFVFQSPPTLLLVGPIKAHFGLGPPPVDLIRLIQWPAARSARCSFWPTTAAALIIV